MKKSYTFWPTSREIVSDATKILAKKVGLVAILIFMFSMASMGQTTNWYLRLDSLNPSTKAQVKVAPNNLLAWTASPNGYGFDTANGVPFAVPTSFTAANQIFNVQTGGFTAATGGSNKNPWTIGANSKLVVGAPDSTLTITINVNTNATVDVLNNATFWLYSLNNSGIIFENLAVGSTVHYAGNTTGNQQVLAANYYNLSFNLSGANAGTGQAYLPLLLPTGTIGVAGTFTTTSKYANFNDFTISFNGTGGQKIPGYTYYNLISAGDKSIPDTLDGTVQVAGTFSNTSGTPLSLYYITLSSKGVITDNYSTVVYNSLIPQNVFPSTYYNLTFSNGQAFQVDSIDYWNKRVVLYDADPDLVNGDKISSEATTATVELDTAAYITGINGTSVYLNEAPTIRAFWYPLGHPAINPNNGRPFPDTLHIISWTPGSGTTPAQVKFNMEIDTLLGIGLNQGDTITSQIIYPIDGKTSYTEIVEVSPDNDSVAYIESLKASGAENSYNPLSNLTNLGTINFGLPGNLPSAKTFTDSTSIGGAFTPGLGAINTAGSTISFVGLVGNQNVPSITYNNLDINPSKSTYVATLQAPPANEGDSTIVTGNVVVQNGTFTLPYNIVANISVSSGATLLFENPNTTLATLGTLATNSTVRYGGNLNVSQQVLPNYNYANLSLADYNGNTWPLILPTTPINVAGSFATSGKYTNLVGSTFNFNGAGGTLLGGATFYNLTVSGNKTIADTLNGTFVIEGTYTDASTGAGVAPTRFNAAGVATGSSSFYYSGLVPQTVAPISYWNLAFSNGQPFYVKSFNNANSTVTLFANAPELSIGDKFTAVANPLVLDSATTITAINDTVLTLSEAPMLRLFVAHVGHSGTVAEKDTIIITGFNSIDSTITLSTIPDSLGVGDTITGQIINGNRFVRAINGNSIQLSLNPFTSLNYYGAINIGTPTKVPTDKTINGTVYIGGTFTPEYGKYGLPTINDGTSTIVYNGLKQNLASITYNNLTINQLSGSTAALTGNTLVKGAFMLQSGKLSTANGKVLTLDVNASFPTPSVDTFFVNGPLAKNFNSTVPFTYPIGKVTNNVSYPGSVTIAPFTADAKTYTAVYNTGNPPNSANFDNTTIADVDVPDYYNVAVSNYSGDTSAQITFQYTPNANAQDSSVLLARNSGGNYIAEANAVAVGSSPLLFTTWAYDTAFGNYIFAYANPAFLPVKFVSLSASALANQTVKVSWENLAEINVSKYVIEGSTDGLTFTEKGSLPAKGAAGYSFIDATPKDGLNYYRIEAIDNSGKITYSNVVSVKIGSTIIGNFSVYPNPVVNSQLSFVLNTKAANYTLKVTNAIGQSVLASTINHIGGTASYSFALPSGLSSGAYFVKLTDGANEFTKTIIIK